MLVCPSNPPKITDYPSRSWPEQIAYLGSDFAFFGGQPSFLRQSGSALDSAMGTEQTCEYRMGEVPLDPFSTEYFPQFPG